MFWDLLRSTFHRARRHGRATRVAFSFCLLAGVGPGRARAFAAQAAPASSLPLVETADQFWRLGQTDAAECQIRARIYVACYYPEWNALWVIWDGGVHYLDGRPHPLPLKSGEWYDLEGVGLPKTQMVEWTKTKLTPRPDLAAPSPKALRQDLSNLVDTSAQLAEVEGVVDQQVEINLDHLQLNLVFPGAHVSAFVRLGPGDMIPQLTGAIVRATGVLSIKRDPNDVVPKLELWCASPAALKAVGTLARDPRFALPSTPIEKLVVKSGGPVVHVVGTMYRQSPGRTLILRDGTGQIRVESAQEEIVHEGDAVEAIGVPDRDGLALVLKAGLYRRAGAPAPATLGMLLRVAEQVRALTPGGIARALGVRISGVVTWSSPSSRFIFVEDGTGGLKVNLPPDQPVPFVGASMIVRGVVHAGDFAPVVDATSLAPGDNIALKEADPITWEEAMTGVNYGRWVEMQGYVRSAVRSPTDLRLQLITAGGEVMALLPPGSDGNFVGSIVRVRGVCDAIVNDRRQLQGIRLLVAVATDVQTIEPAPADPFVTPMESIGDLMRYNPATPLNRRVQVTGVVLLQVPQRLLFVQDGSDALMVLSAATERLEPGDRVAVVGIAGHEGGRLILRDAVFKRVSHEAPPAPLVLEGDLAPNSQYDCQLVRVQGRLLSREAALRGVRLQLQHENRIYTALLDQSDPRAWTAEVGSVLQLTGVYRVQLDEYRHPRSFSVNLRSSSDLVVLVRPPWWTATRVIWMVVSLLGCALLALVWGLILARKNEQLRRADRDLRRANEELEARVAARTRDLTDEVEHRRESEQLLAQERLLLRTLIDNLPAYLYVKDTAGRFVIGNLPHARLLGAASTAEVIGKTEADFWPPDLAAQRELTDRRVMESGEPLILLEEPYAFGTETGWHSTTRVPLRDASGRISGLIAISQDITSRKEVEADRENLHRQLLDTSRRAGMAEVATGVLHNIGNVLNSVNVSAAVAAEIVVRSKSDKLKVLIDLLAGHRNDLATFFAQDRRAQRIPDYLEALAGQLRAEQAELLKELHLLQRNIDHIKEVVAMQQAYAKISGVTENVAVQELIDDALRINADALVRHRIEVVRDVQVNPTLVVERHKVLQILVNLVSNAKYACDHRADGRQVIVTTDQAGGCVTITVRDNGVGIAPENLTRIFSHGFTTRKNGHGFGLHSGAIAAKELGGSLKVFSDGIGTGATFTLTLPLSPVAETGNVGTAETPKEETRSV